MNDQNDFPDNTAATERRLRRLAARQGLILTKSRRRDPRATDFGVYWLVTSEVTGGGWRSRALVSPEVGLSLAEVETYLTQVSSIKSPLADYFENQANWRDWKAEQYPDDDRNAMSADVLRGAAKYVRSLPDDDNRVVALDRLLYREDGIISPLEEFGRLTIRHGFDGWTPDHDGFLTDLVDAARQDYKELQATQ